MGYYVHLQVSFNCDENEPVAKLAQKYLPLVDGEFRSSCTEAVWYLEELSKRIGSNMGTKGGVSLWGMIGNYTNAERFCGALRPFFKELLLAKDTGPLSFHHIIVQTEQEQSEKAVAYEIYLEDPYCKSPDTELKIVRHDLPFCWNQY